MPLVAFLAAVLLLLGVALLNDGASNSVPIQSAKLIGGAVFLSFGFMSTWVALKNWLKWRYAEKGYRGR